MHSVSHSRSIVECEDRTELPLKPYEKNPAKNVMLPAFAKPKHVAVEQRLLKLTEWAEKAGINCVEDHGAKVSIITSGISYQYVKEAMGDSVNYLKLGMAYPLPEKLILDFAAKAETVYVVEELDDFIETHCKKLGLSVIGKEKISPLWGILAENCQKTSHRGEEAESVSLEQQIPVRPPVMCCGCPHRGVFYALKREKFMSAAISAVIRWERPRR